MTERRYAFKTKQQPKKKEKEKMLERQNGGVVRFELAPPEEDFRKRRLDRVSFHCATKAVLKCLMLFLCT